MRIAFDLGPATDGKSAGKLRLYRGRLEPIVGTPAALKYSVVRSDVEVIYDPQSQNLRQIRTPLLLVDIVPVNNYKYTIKYYDQNNWGTKVDGFYEPVDDSEYLTWIVENLDASPTVCNNLRVAKVVDVSGTPTTVAIRDYEYSEPSGVPTWTLYSADGASNILRTETRSIDEDPVTHERTVTYEVQEDSALIYRRVETHEKFDWGHRLVHYEVGSSSDDNPLMEGTREYYENIQEPGRYRRLKSWTNPDGSWVVKDYDEDGRQTAEIRPWLDSDKPSTADTSEGQATVYDYSPVDGQELDDGSVEPNKPRTVTKLIEGTAVAKTYYQYYIDGSNLKVKVEERCADPSNAFGATGNLRTTTKYDQAGTGDVPPQRVASVEHADGTYNSYIYDNGTYTPGSGQPGSFTVDSGTDLRRILTHEGASGPVANKSTREITVMDQTGHALMHQVEVYDGSAYQAIGWIIWEYDSIGRVTDVLYSNGAHWEAQPEDCCGTAWTVDAAGVKTFYGRDALGRLTSVIKEGVSASGNYAAQADITTNLSLVANTEGSVQITEKESGQLSLTDYVQYDFAGRMIGITDAAGLETEFSYEYPTDGGRIVTTTRPDGATEVTTYYRDGSIKNVTGTSVVEKHYTKGVDATSDQRWTAVYTGPVGTSSPMWESNTLDALSRPIEMERPGYNQSTLTTTLAYDAQGRLEHTTSTGAPDTLYEYDGMSRLLRTGQDVDMDGNLVLDSDDRIRETETVYGQASNVWWRKTISRVYPVSDDDTPTVTGESWEQLTDLPTDTLRVTWEWDIHGNVTETTVTVDGSEKVLTRTIDYPDVISDVSTVRRNGLVQTSTSKIGVTTTYGYDALARRVTVADPKTGTTTTVYVTSDTPPSGKLKGYVDYVEDADSRTTSYTYDAAGRVASVTNPESQVQYSAYTGRGELERTWGDTPYPVRYVYDDYGRRTEMYTFQTGDDWDESSWPDPEPSGDKTTWKYEEATGLLLKKVYADATEQDPSIAYTYTADGKLATRTWRRGVTTTYTYHDGTGGTLLTGELKSVSYSDSTPGVEYSYNRMGQFATISDVLGEDSHVFTYNDALQLDTETIDVDGSTDLDRVITRKYWESQSIFKGKDKGFQIGTDQDPDADYDATYYYNALVGGRLTRVTGPGLPAYGAQYSTISGSPLMSQVDFKSDSNTVVATGDWTYEFEAAQNPTSRNLIRSVENIVKGTPDVQVSKYTYTNDDLGRRTSVENSGTAFSQTEFNLWGYNDRSELTSSHRYDGQYTATPDPQDEITAQRRVYAYDPIGNRKDATEGTGDPVYYCANNVNQYKYTDDEADTCPTPATPTEEFDYDDDGNLIEDGMYTYTWDGENRLIALTPVAQPVNGDKKLEFMYDYMSRRIAKTVYTYNGSIWATTEVLYFIYDKWNVVLVMDALGEDVIRKYTWGLDLSGQAGADGPDGIHSAGGIAGLLATEDVEAGGGASNSYWYFYDANGNVGQLLKASDQSVASNYEYDPYGNTITSSGTYADTNPFRFSTKWFDDEAEFSFYGYRFYLPRLGRWSNQDPVAEQGGLNLYAYVMNLPTTDYDSLGLFGGSACLYFCSDFARNPRPPEPEDPGPEPDCSPSPTNPGIAACMEAASCRFKKCKWAADVEYYDCPNSARYSGALAACSAVWVAETVACVPGEVVPR